MEQTLRGLCKRFRLKRLERHRNRRSVQIALPSSIAPSACVWSRRAFAPQQLFWHRRSSSGNSA